MRGETHRPQWEDSAAYRGTPDDKDGARHRTAYLWMVEQYEKAMGAKMNNAPAWVVFCRERAEGFVKCNAQEVVIELDVPDAELFITQYCHSPMCKWECVLHGDACHLDECTRVGCQCSATPESIRESWSRLLTLGDDASNWQGVLDRFEPSWYVGSG